MRRSWVAGGILLAIVLVLAGLLSRTPTRTSQASPISVVVSTPSPMPPIRKTIVEISDPPGRIRLCAGEGIRFINDSRDLIILTASDFSFSSGVLRPGDAFAVFPTSGVTVGVSGLDGVAVRDPYRVEVVICEEPSQYP